MSRATANGGFPEPPEGGVIRVVRARHAACGHRTRVRLPAHISAQAVRRVVCHECAMPFEAPTVEEVPEFEPDVPEFDPDVPAFEPEVAGFEPEMGEFEREVAKLMPEVAEPPRRRRLPRLPGPPRLPSLPKLSTPSLPDWLRDPSSRTWRLVSIPIAGVAVIAGLVLIQGGSDEGSDTPFAETAAEVTAEPAPPEEASAPDAKPGDASLINGSSFSLALPPGWERTGSTGGATFTAAADAGDADATLWVERDAGLTFPDFEAQSLDTLQGLAGSARVIERIPGSTPDATTVRLAADNPAGSPAYEVTLRTAGPYRYYLATTVQPDASKQAAGGADLIHGSFQPIDPDGGK